MRMDFSAFNEWYNTVKPLTQNEYEQSKLKAEKVVEKRIGEKPTKKEFKRETESNFTPVTILVLIVFIATWVVSSVEQIRFMGHEAFKFSQSITDYIGIELNPFVIALIFQFGLVAITEFSMVLFMIQWRIQIKHNDYTWHHKNKFIDNVKVWISQFFNIYFALGILSMIIVLYINITSGMFILLGIAIPFITIGLGLSLEELVSKYIIEQQEIHKSYTKEYNMWMEVSKEPNKHPDWKRILYQSIWDSITSKNHKYGIETDVIGEWKALAVEKELERDEWSTKGVQRHQAMQSSGLTVESLQGKNELEILLAMIEGWNKTMNPIVKTENYEVDMKNFIFKSEFEEEPKQYSSIGFLKRRISDTINKNKSE